jgi:outer membrane protein, multidrug efflux system
MEMSRRNFFCSLALIILLCAGCRLGPKYEEPEVEVPCEWQSPISEGMSCETADCFLWWESLNDPVLNALIEQAAAQNLDLHIAFTRICEARILRKGGVASLLPHVDGSLTYGYLQYNQGTLNRLLGTGCHGNRQRTLNFFEAGFDAEWEIDLFGKNVHDLKALDAEAQASEEAFSCVWITLAAEIVRHYVELRGYQLQLSLVDKDIEAQRDILGLTRSLLEGGFTGSVEVMHAEEQLRVLEAQKPQTELAIAKTIHRLSVLLGLAPGNLYAELCEAGCLPSLPCCRPIGIPSELLRRRPDIRKAERELAAATERVGSAIAALFPRISLYGFLGDIAALCGGNGMVGYAGPQILLPIFNSRLLQQDVNLNKIQTQQALYRYQKTVLEALEEAENAISSFHYELEKSRFLADARSLSQEAHMLSFQLYQKGLKNYLEVQTANLGAIAAERAYVQSQIELLMHYISLYKALGGGWDADSRPADICSKDEGCSSDAE